MAMIENLAIGFEAALTFQNLAYCFLGVFLGTLIGVLPGIGPVPTIAMLLPITFALEPLTGLIMLAGIYYGAQYGGSTTAILVNLPGEASSVVTCLDGYQMARKGKAGAALAVAALGSFFAGTVGTAVLAAFAPLLTGLAIQFGPADYFSLMALGLVLAVFLSSGSVPKSVAMVILGILLGLVGTDVSTGAQRFTLGSIHLIDGLDFVALAMGIFGVVEVVTNIERGTARDIFTNAVGKLRLSREDARAAAGASLRGTVLGSVLGVLPGGGGILASFSAYALEKKISRHPEKFGTGVIEGVAGPESANNAAAQTAFVPLLTLGLPSNAVMALMVGAMMIHNIAPGPQVISSNPTLFWGLVASMWIGNAMLVVLNLPLINIWVKFLTVPYRILYPIILAFCCIGVYSIGNNAFDVVILAIFALVGYLFAKLDCPPAPLLLGFVLGPLMEENLRRALQLSRGSMTTFVSNPISFSILMLILLVLIVSILPSIQKKRSVAFEED
ncbi:tripartite tricarboxylate transporter permease [Ancylobacter terrae]|uniref:tripartite tricarboxylate transporter permease n=1 Tax=Ancylobacter sp. sgz301288 TaxID=3342077 RepID=UPI003858090B